MYFTLSYLQIKLFAVRPWTTISGLTPIIDQRCIYHYSYELISAPHFKPTKRITSLDQFSQEPEADNSIGFYHMREFIA